MDDATGAVIFQRWYDPCSFETPVSFAERFVEDIKVHAPTKVIMERYVPYKGQAEASLDNSERTNILIGVLAYALKEAGPLYLLRAAEWKVKAAHALRRRTGFTNPSQKLDKKFSMAAAKQVFSGFKGTDHEADAIVLAWLGSILP